MSSNKDHEVVAEKLAQFLVNLIRNHPELLAKHTMPQNRRKSQK